MYSFITFAQTKIQWRCTDEYLNNLAAIGDPDEAGHMYKVSPIGMDYRIMQPERNLHIPN